ncbi:MAG: hypothetical protein PHQ81_11655 [Methanofollis sp.]|nr:hypothetical protein [Methanofollis sp.]
MNTHQTRAEALKSRRASTFRIAVGLCGIVAGIATLLISAVAAIVQGFSSAVDGALQLFIIGSGGIGVAVILASLIYIARIEVK